MSLSRILKRKVENVSILEVEHSSTDSKIVDIPLFDFTKRFFSKNKESWSEVSDEVKMKHSFMLLQFLSINEAEIAMMIQNSISPRTIDVLHLLFSNNYDGKTPGWMFTKVYKNKLDVEVNLKKYDGSSIQLLREKHNLDFKDFEFLMLHHGSELKEFLDEQEKNNSMKKTK